MRKSLTYLSVRRLLPIVLAAVPAVASAQEPPSPATPPEPAPAASVSAEELEALRQRVRLLEAQVDALAAPAEAEQGDDLDLTTKVNGFASVDLAYDGEITLPYFHIDEMLLVYQANLGSKYGVYSEIAYEPEEGLTAVDLESLEVRYRPTDHFNLRFGRFHTPLSYWSNTAFHGSFRFTPVHRPFWLALEEHGAAPLPVHQVGVMAYGSEFAGFWQVSYHAAVSNGRSTAIGGIAQDLNLSGAPAASVGVSLTSPGGVTFGVAGYTHTLTPPDPDVVEVVGDNTLQRFEEKWTEHIGSAHLVVDGSSVSLMAEGFFLGHVDDLGTLHPTYGGYAVASLPSGKTTPYLRGEYMSAPDVDDPLFGVEDHHHLYAAAGAGVRHDLGLRVALKGEALGINHDGEGWHPEAFVQLATMF